jgi:non-specific serine/threonine protein kinase
MNEGFGMAVNRLPVALSSFIGRGDDLATVEHMVFSSRLVTITGTGGSGKTRLALEAAISCAQSIRDGAWFVDLTSLRDPALIPDLIVHVIGLNLAAGAHVLEALVHWLNTRQALLVLDNCEHLVEACSRVVTHLLMQTGGTRILATSREPLGVAGEAIYPLEGLALPEQRNGDRVTYDAATFLKYDSVRLFVERARSVSPGFSPGVENFAAIYEICRRLDGLPLAIELASARVRSMTVQEIASRLDHRFTFLSAGQRAVADPRHQTLRSAVDWSYALLIPEEQVLLRRLAVFPAGCTIDTAESVCGGEGIDLERVIDLLSSLVDKSLLIAQTTGRPQARYHMLETIREYAVEKLEASGEMTRLRDRYLALFLARAEEASPHLGDAYQQLWLNWLEGEHDNLRAALAWALESVQVEAGLRIANAILRFWEIRGHVPEGMGWFARLLSAADERTSLVTRASAYTYAGFMAMFLGNVAKADEYAHEAVACAEAVGDPANPILILALGSLANSAHAAGDFQTAFALNMRTLSLLEGARQDRFIYGMSLLGIGNTAVDAGEYVTARGLLEEALQMAQADGDTFREAHTYTCYGDLARCKDDFSGALAAYEKSVTLLRDLNATHDLAAILHSLARTCLHLGDIERAHALFSESMTLHEAEQSRPGMGECLVGFGLIALALDRPAACARLLAAAAAIGGKQWIASVWPAKRLPYDETLAQIQASLLPAVFQAEQAAGRRLSLEQAIEFTRALLPRSKAASGTRAPGRLSERESEITGLIAKGKTNGEIAHELVLSRRTVEKHAENILGKLGLESRAQLIRWAIEEGLAGQ